MRWCTLRFIWHSRILYQPESSGIGCITPHIWIPISKDKSWPRKAVTFFPVSVYFNQLRAMYTTYVWNVLNSLLPVYICSRCWVGEILFKSDKAWIWLQTSDLRNSNTRFIRFRSSFDYSSSLDNGTFLKAFYQKTTILSVQPLHQLFPL